MYQKKENGCMYEDSNNIYCQIKTSCPKNKIDKFYISSEIKA